VTDPSRNHNPQSRRQQQQNAVIAFLKARWLVIVLVIAVIVFVAQNRSRVSIDILWIHIKSSLWFILAVTAAAGFVIGFTLARRRARARHTPPEASRPESS
jgi:lipopolysaccharide assembly protein A